MGIGNNPIEGGQYFRGGLDNLKIYNKSLSAQEIDRLYQTGTSGSNELSGNDLRGVILGVSPNPTTELLNIKHNFLNNQPLLIRVFDIQGRQVDLVRFDNSEIPNDVINLKVGNYPQGTYSLNFIYGGKNLGAVLFTKE
jgi:hypothetical protein